MDHGLDLISTLTGALAAALVLGLLAQRLRLSPIVGYLIAGVIVGPFTPGFVAHGGIANQFAELGVILLMFGVGLNLHVDELMRVRRVAIPGAIAAMGAATGGGWLATRTMGWSGTAGVLYGLAIAIASTVVLLRVFADRDLLHTQTGHLAIGWLLVEDFVVVLVVILLPIVKSGSGGRGVAPFVVALVVALAKIGALVALALGVGRRAIPALLAVIARTRSRELFTLAVLTLALGVAVGAAKLFGASMALGAFLAGLVVGQSKFGARAASEALPMRDAFAVLFFVATGMLLDPAQIVPNARVIAATLAVVWIAKPAVTLVVVLAFRYPPKTAVGLALGLGQIGEFSFMVAGLGGHLGLLPPQAAQALVATSLISVTLNPLFMRLVEPVAARLAARQARRDVEHDDAASARAAVPAAHRAVVVGYGPVGRSVVKLLDDHGIRPTVIELNHDTVAALEDQGIDALYGDAAQREVLERAGISGARSLVLTASTPPEATIRMAKELAPDVVVLARVPYVSERARLHEAGASEVISAEGEVALAMIERLLAHLGAHADQIDRARERLRRDV